MRGALLATGSMVQAFVNAFRADRLGVVDLGHLLQADDVRSELDRPIHAAQLDFDAFLPRLGPHPEEHGKTRAADVRDLAEVNEQPLGPVLRDDVLQLGAELLRQLDPLNVLGDQLDQDNVAD